MFIFTKIALGIMLQEGGEWWKSICSIVAEIKTIFIHGKMVKGETTDGRISLQFSYNSLLLK